MAKKKIVKKNKTTKLKKTKSKAMREEMKKKKPTKKPLKKEEDLKIEYSSKADLELDVPIVPEAPKKTKKLILQTSNLSSDVLERIKKIESPDIKVVLVNCERCKAVIPIPIPKKAVLDSELPIVPISFVHKNLQKEDQHCLTVHLDHDFDIRRQRLSDVVLSSD
ncbi:MAG: hypothetical protein ACFE9Q_11730 [Candidatus Hodarchaeota archaeon]